MARFGLLGRLLLIILSALLALAVATLMLLRWETTHHPPSGPFLRVRQFAADIDLLTSVPPPRWPAALRALSGHEVHLATSTSPPALDGLIHAPLLETRLRRFARTPAGAAARAYTSADQANRDPRDGVEGFLKLGVARLPDGRFLVARPVFAAATGGTPLGLPLGLWIGLCGAAVAALAVLGAIRELRPLRDLARALDTFDGTHAALPVEVAGAPDVRALVEAVGAMQRRVATLVHERTLMVGAISHDLRTLLTRLQLRAATLPDDAARARLTADLDVMGRLVEDALAFARGVDTGARRQRLDLADLVATEVAEREAVGGDLPITAALADAPLIADEVALRRVVANLLDNACRFGRARVQVTTAVQGDRVLLTVEDDGSGIPADQRVAVLLPFHRVEGSRSRATGGTGLGLAIASRIVEAHGGALAIGTSVLGGARMIVRLPAQQN